MNMDEQITTTPRQFCKRLCRLGVSPVQLLVYSEYHDAYHDFRHLGKTHKDAVRSTMEKCRISRRTVYNSLKVFQNGKEKETERN